ncbi:3986_t:CDS:2, partial [Gigaspora rosea]
KNLYAAICKFRPTKVLLNDAATVSNWIDEQKKEDTRWIVARDWEDDNTLKCLFWMTPSQVENWIQFSNCIFNDVTHKTNRYGMRLSLFVGFDNNQQNILLAQGLFIDKIIKTTGIESAVILTNSDPAVDSAVKE